MGSAKRPRRATRPLTHLCGVVLTALALAAISACSNALSTAPDTAELSVEVHQTRSNVAARQLTIGVTNESSHPVEITSARLVSDQFVDAAVWTKDSTTIGAGVTADLPVPLPAANCAADDPQPTVELEYHPIAENDAGEGSGTTESSGTHSVVLEPDDRLGQLGPLFVADCFAEAAGQVATISADTPPRISTAGDRLVADLDLSVTPGGGRGSLTVLSARSTTLLSQVDPVSNLPTENRQVDATVSGTAQATTITLRLVPSRCDPHAVAEDKLGTVFRLEVSLDDGEGVPPQTGMVPVAAADGVRAQLYAFVERACAESQ